MIQVPDRIFALGGAGKQLAFELLESDWVLEEILAPKRAPCEMEVTIVDTAEEEAKSGAKGGDLERVDEIKRHIKSIRSEYRDQETEHAPGNIDVKYKLLTENIRLDRQLDLIGSEEVDRITAGNGMPRDDWWLQSGHINENLDFAKGVIRKRGLSKALYYKTYAEDDLQSVIDLPEKGQVALLVGMGGGTGAGLLIDLAHHLKEEQSTANLTLFGVLPNNAEGKKENTNAFALLSELEYLSLTDSNPFIAQILFPIEPTDYKGKIDQMSPSVDYLQEFDEAFVYSLLLYYNTQKLKEDLFDSSSYAPFSMAVPMVLRYNIAAIEEFRATIDAYLERKEESMNAETRLYDGIDEFLEIYYPDVSGELSEEDEVDLERRIDQIETLISLDLFSDLEYESTSVFRTEVLTPAREAIDAEEQETPKGLEQFIDVMVESVRAKSLQQLDASIKEDQRLAEVLEQDVLLLGRRKDILRRLKGVSNPKVRGALEYLVGLQEGNAGAKSTQLNRKYEQAQTALNQTESKLQSTREELEQLRTNQSAEITQKTNKWADNVDAQLEQLDTLESAPIRQNVEALRGSLQDFRRKLERARSPGEVDAIEVTDIRESLTALDENLNRVDVYFESSDITDAVETAKKARVTHFNVYLDKGIGKFFPWESKTEKERKSAQKQFAVHRTKLRGQDTAVLEVADRGGEFKCKVEFDGTDLLLKIDENRTELVEDMLTEFERVVTDPLPDDVSRLREELEHGSDQEQLRQVVSQALEREISGADELQSETDRLEEKLQQQRNETELFEAARRAITDLNGLTTTFAQEVNAYREGIRSLEETSHQQSPIDEEYSFLKSVQPHNVFRATGKHGLADSELLDERKEKQQLQDYISELADRARSAQYCGLRKRKLIGDKSRYEGIRINVGLASEASLHGIVNLESPFQNAFELDKSKLTTHYGQWQRDFGGPWDIGMTTFITGVFLDNIRLAVGPNGYAEHYYNYKAKLGDDILIHHALGLEEGYFVRRKNMFNVENIEDVKGFLRTEGDVKGMLLNTFETVSLQDESSGDGQLGITDEAVETSNEPAHFEDDGDA
ncbi:Tubulin like [Halogranum amylolyticum]|uniref:Tubulin like n=1 Tax=Halogranum amylolyticum TaxID=660520 RepID=A0A1H8VG99_9EURY|nr:tubulin-like doman-containing protein [Halogranum amylolyticum]SEP14237.1 Tubulin like [Halogranum amylolyticum]